MDKTIIKDKWIRIIGVPTIVVLLVLLDDTGPDGLTTEMLVFKLFRNAFFVLCYWESNRLLFTYMRNRYPDLKDTSKRILHHLLLFIIYMIFAGLIFTMINVRLPQNRHEDFWSEYLEILKKSGVLLGVVTVVYECVYYFGLYEKSQLESERLKKEALISQVELLRSQISPHFLFNSLNALITMVPEDPQLSVLFIQKLSNVYRHVLSYNGRDVIDLQTEKNFLDDYIFLHQIRFNSNLIVQFQLPDKLDHLSLIPFTLQMLVENAIKHNIISSRKPLTIQIVLNKNFLVVSNNLQKKTSGVESTNTGLKNIINRYELLNGKQVDVTVTPTEFRVSLPLIFSNEGL